MPWIKECSDRWALRAADDSLIAEVVCSQGGSYYIVTCTPGLDTADCQALHNTLERAQQLCEASLRAAGARIMEALGGQG